MFENIYEQLSVCLMPMMPMMKNVCLILWGKNKSSVPVENHGIFDEDHKIIMDNHNSLVFQTTKVIL